MATGDMVDVTERLYLGNITAAYDNDVLTDARITHILTLNISPIEEKSRSEKIQYKLIEVRDLETEDLLQYFEECFSFIDGALRDNPNNKVLIHCFAGCSRSATVMIAYLMYSHRLPLEEAWAMVKIKCPRIKPNYGFTKQLNIFDDMGGVINKHHPVYRQYRLSRLSERAQAGEFSLEDENFDSGEAISTQLYYKCVKCRQALFRKYSVMTHVLGKGEAAFDWRNKISTANENEADCDTTTAAGIDCDKSIFIEPVKWMAESIQQMEGKLNCPKCHAKIGSFIWYGERCPCGAWVAPAFHIQRSKVDEVKPRLLPNIIQSLIRSQIPNLSDASKQTVGQSETSVKSCDTKSDQDTSTDFEIMKSADILAEKLTISGVKS